MSRTNTLQNSVPAMTGTVLNRYQLDIPSCRSALDVEEFSGQEHISELYHYTLLFNSPDNDITAAQLLSKPASLIMRTDALTGLSELKVVHGVVTHFKRLSGSRDQTTYQIILEPFLALLRNSFRTHRFFVNQSVPEVVARVLTEHGLQGWEYAFLLTAEYPKREQINQYQENDLAFIERLLSEVLPLGRATAGAVGMSVTPSQLLVLLLAATLTAAATLVIGPLSFVGLMAPHIASMLGFRRAIPQLVISGILGGMLMMLADWCGRMVLFPYQVPAGLLATFIGAPYFIYLLRKQSR